MNHRSAPHRPRLRRTGAALLALALSSLALPARTQPATAAAPATSATGATGAASAANPAADWRDPTEMPAALRAAAAASGTGPGADASAAEVRHLVFVQGRAYVVSQGRRLGVGDKLGEARITRIEESAVWLSEAGRVRREPLFNGVEKRAPAEAAAAPNRQYKSQPRALAPATRETP